MEQDRERSRRLALAERDRAQKLFNEAFSLWQAGKFEAAKAGFERGLGIDPANGPANFYLGDILQRNYDSERARARYQRSRFFAPDSAEGLQAEVALGKLPPPPPPPVPEPPLKLMVGGAQDCGLCPRIISIPAGTFVMGTPESETGHTAYEWPQHRVSIGAFALGVYPVTFVEWDACVTDGGCNGYIPDDRGWGRGQRPVINVSWSDAQSYVVWLTRRTGKRYRLPTEAEWEYAARAGTTTVRDWGDAIGAGNATCSGCGSWWDDKQTAPVGQFRPNAFGLYDMLGNVGNWVEDCIKGNNYLGAPSDGQAQTSGSCEKRIIRGGGWGSFASPNIRAGSRGALTPNSRRNQDGFRVARTL